MSEMAESDLGKSRHGIRHVIMDKIDGYVDALAPQIQPQIEAEIKTFQQKTLDSIDDLVLDAFRSLFRREGTERTCPSPDERPPDRYGLRSLPFADELVALSRSVSQLADDANDDLGSILDLIGEGQQQKQQQQQGRAVEKNDSFVHDARAYLSAALDLVSGQGQSEDDKAGSASQPPSALDGLLGILTSSVKNVSRNPDETARLISPEIKTKMAVTLATLHAPIAEKFTHIALAHIKRWLRGNTSTGDLADGVKDKISDMVSGLSGLFGHKDKPRGSAEDTDREDEGGGHIHTHTHTHGGFSGLISHKLSTGLAKVHREVRLDFRRLLAGIEKTLFEALPDDVQGPLETILGGNPFDAKLALADDANLADSLASKLAVKIHRLVRKVQEALREAILAVVNGGHRKLERASWLFVQDKVEMKVRSFLPDVRVTVPDDIGNEGVSVGPPRTGDHLAGPALAT